LPAVQSIRLVDGKAVVTATSAGFKAFSKTVAIVGGARVSLAIVLDPIEQRAVVALSAPTPLPRGAAAPAPAALLVTERDPGAGSWKPPVGVGLIATGAGLLAWGITWIVVDGEDDCPRSGPACRDVHDTGSAGWLLTAGGAAAVSGGLLVILGQGTSSRHVAVTPSSVSLRGRF